LTPAEIQSFLHARIPLTIALGVTVVTADSAGVTLRAPLAPNVNHQMTAFAGSLASLGLLAGWVWLVLALRERHPDASVVIRRSTIEYLAPVSRDLEATCTGPASGLWAPFERALRERGRGRLKLEASVLAPSGEVAMQSSGEYAARTPRPARSA
jgi:thioesterase domain-containing protein